MVENLKPRSTLGLNDEGNAVITFEVGGQVATLTFDNPRDVENLGLAILVLATIMKDG